MKIECTLQEACEKAKKDGGMFWASGITAPRKYKYSPDSDCFVDESGCNFTLVSFDFNRNWIYEPPQKSVFQELRSTYPLLSVDKGVYEIARYFWNAAIAAVLKTEITVTKHDGSISKTGIFPTEQIEKLREI